jgi:hypothetical protein
MIIYVSAQRNIWDYPNLSEESTYELHKFPGIPPNHLLTGMGQNQSQPGYARVKTSAVSLFNYSFLG